MVNAALDAGVNFFDTANSYVGGVSETMLGVALKGRRQDAIIASKFFNPMGGRPNDSGMSRLHIKQQIEGSLKRLQTDYIDVYYIHHVDHQTPLEEMLRALRRSPARGQDPLHRLLELRGVAPDGGAVGQRDQGLGELLPTSRSTAWWCATSTRRSCRRWQLRGWASSPGRRWPGYLAGKYTPGSLKVQGTRSAEGWGFQNRFFAPNHAEILQTLLDTAKEIGKSPAQTALRWVMDQPFMTSAIVGARNAEQLRETLGAGGWRLPAAALEKLNKVSKQPHRYPRSFEEPMPERRNSAIKMPGI